MSLFEFLMILLSIIVGLGIAEILTGVGRILRERRQHEFSLIHSALVVAVFFGLLQSFWESWEFRTTEVWTFPAMLLMLASPILLLTIAHVLFPTKMVHENLEQYYFSNPGLPWRLAGATVVLGTLFRPVAFGMPLFVAENASALPVLVICVLLGTSTNRMLHRILAPFVALFVISDTLSFSYAIN